VGVRVGGERVNILRPTLNSQSKKPGGLADDAATTLPAAVWAVESVEEHHTNKCGTYYTH